MRKYSGILVFSCALLFAVSATAQSAFTVSVTTTKYSCVNGTAKVSVSGGQTPYFYNWSHGAQGETVTGLTPGSYNVSIVDGNGKDTLVTVTIEEEKCKVYIANSFSPNNDDISDTWSTTHIEKYPDFVLQVYNRWGQIVHTQKGEYKAWDGKHLGVDVPVGTYYYVFYYKEGDDSDIEKGSVTIMR
ncbi:MAG: large protein [Bacteroidetes bacterium]|nr:large protein [Bacteroidota bacterium]